MKISNKQALAMYDILKWSASVHGSIVGYSVEDRIKIINEIFNQQSNKLIELE